MSGMMIEYAAAGATCQGWLAKPPSGRGPGLLVIQEWWGLVDHIKEVAERFAAAGFVALAPDLYHGEAAAGPDDAGRKMMALDIAKAGQELAGAAQYLRDCAALVPQKIGALGFCMGGQLALYAACEHPQLIDAAVDFYGIHPSVALRVEQLRASVLAHFGRADGFVNQEVAEALVGRVRQAGKDIEAHFYDAGHAFFNDARPEAYNGTAADLAWARTIAFLRRHLS